MRVAITIALMSLLCLTAIGNDGNSSKLHRLNEQNVAIDGYSPVSYFTKAKAEHGSPEFIGKHQDVTYWLTDLEQVALFEQDPEKYLPAHGGWCSLMLSGSGKRSPANPEAWKIVNGQLLMFWSGNYQGTQISGLRNWEIKTEGDPKQETKRLKTANKTWLAILKGKRKSPVVLFNERDKGLVLPHHLAQ